MTYLERKNSEKTKQERRKKKDWEDTEDKVRRWLRFTCDKHCRALGIDGVRIEKGWFYKGVRISDDKAGEIIGRQQREVQKKDREQEHIWDFLEMQFKKLRLVDDAYYDSIQRIFDEIIGEWLYPPFVETQSPVSTEIVTFLEVKDWREGQKVNADEIDKFVGKMIRGDADHGVFVARGFSRPVRQVVQDHNKILEKVRKSVEIRTLKSLKIS